MKKKENREKRKLIKRGKNGEPTVIDFNLSKAVIISIVIGGENKGYKLLEKKLFSY